MTVAKWHCKNCNKNIYTDSLDKPTCHCSWFSEVHLLWVDFKPTKRIWDEIKESGSMLRKKYTTKEDVWKFTANAYAKNEEEVDELLKKLPF